MHPLHSGASMTIMIRKISAGQARRCSGAVMACLLAVIAAPKAWAAPEDPFDTVALRPGAASQRWDASGATPPCADTSAVPDPLALADAIDLALCNNPRTRASWAAAKAAAAQVGIARGTFLPNISATGTGQRTDARNTVTSGQRTQLSGSITLNYLLFDFGARQALLEQARQTLFAADWAHNATLQTVLLDAAQAYYQLYAGQEAGKATLAASRAAQQSLDSARARQRAGSATRADVLQAQTAFSQAELARTQAEGDAITSEGVLANRLGFSAARPIHIVPPGDLDAARVANAALEELVAAATARRPDLLAARARVRAAESNVQAQQAANRPVISAFGTGAATQSDPGLDTRSTAIGLQVTIPIFTGYQNTYRIRAAREQVELQEATRDQLRNDVSLDVWRAYQQLRTQGRALDTAADLEASARESYDVALGRYRAGVGTVTDLLNAQSALANASLQRIQSRFLWNVAKATLAQAIGTLDIGLFADASAATPSKQ